MNWRSIGVGWGSKLRLWLRLLLLRRTVCRGRGLGSLKLIHGSWDSEGGGSASIGVIGMIRMVTGVTVRSGVVASPAGNNRGRGRWWWRRGDGGRRGRRRWRRRRRGPRGSRGEDGVGEHIAAILLLLVLILKPNLILHHRRRRHLLHFIDVRGRVGLLLLVEEGRGLLLLVHRRRRGGRGRGWSGRVGLRRFKQTLVLWRRRGLLGAVALVAPGVVGDLVGGDVIAVVARRPAAVLVVAVDEVGVGVVVQRDDDLRVLPLVVLSVVFNVAAARLVEGELAVAVQVIVVRGCDGNGGILCRGRGNRRPILCGRPLVHL